MLAGNNNGGNLDRLAVLIFNSNLRFSVRIKIRQFAAFTNFGKLYGKFVRQADRHRHQFLCFVAGIAEHHALIPCSVQVILIFLIMLQFKRSVYAEGDIRALLIERYANAASIAVKAFFTAVIADFADGFSDDSGNIHLRV